MNCAHCGYPLAQFQPQCPLCEEAAAPARLALPAPSQTRNRLPYLLLAAMVLVGLVLYLLIPMEADRITEPEATVSASETLPQESKALFQKDCFILINGVLQFDESRFQPNPILVVPAAIDDHSVTAIGENCFRDLEGVTTVVLPSSIESIGASAFAGCRDLRGVCVPNAVTEIGADAFRDCSRLEAVYLPTGLDQIGSGAFAGCPVLTFVFYNGLLENWQAMYPETITPYTWVICWDGEYRHIGKTP